MTLKAITEDVRYFETSDCGVRIYTSEGKTFLQGGEYVEILDDMDNEEIGFCPDVDSEIQLPPTLAIVDRDELETMAPLLPQAVSLLRDCMACSSLPFGMRDEIRRWLALLPIGRGLEASND